MSKIVSDVQDSDFEAEVLQSDIPVLVDFWAPWCEPCKSMSPIIEEIANEYAGKVKIVKVNVDENKKHAAQFKVRGIPNFLIFKDGEAKEQIVGVVPKLDLLNALDGVV